MGQLYGIQLSRRWAIDSSIGETVKDIVFEINNNSRVQTIHYCYLSVDSAIFMTDNCIQTVQCNSRCTYTVQETGKDCPPKT